MSRNDKLLILDMLQAIAAIRDHRSRGTLSDAMVFDAVRMRLFEIGEATKALSEESKAFEPDIPWSQIARMRDRLAHRYFDNELTIIESTVADAVPELEQALHRMKQQLG